MKIELTEKQSETVSTACELLARIGIGQLDILERLPLREPRDYGLWHRDIAVIRKLLAHHNIMGVDGYTSSLGITMGEVSEEAKIAWDIYKSLTDPGEILTVSREGRPKVEGGTE